MLDRTIAPPFGEVSYQPFAQVERHALPSGVPLYLLNAGEQPVLKFELRLKCGSWYESQKAVAWFTAKMLMEGTTQKSANELMQAFESLGAYVDIEPGFDAVSISIYGVERNFTEVLVLLMELLNTPSFPAGELEALKDIRVDEIKINDAKSNMLASKKVREALFGLDHPYGKALTEKDIVAIQPSNVSFYYQQSFFNNPEIFLSGKVSEPLLAWVVQNFKFPFAEQQVEPEDFPMASTTRIFVEKPESLQSSIRLAWNCPNMRSDDYFDFLIATTLLGGYFGSRLMKNIREDKGYTYGINAHPVHLEHSSFSLISTDVKAESTCATIDETRKELDKLKDQKTAENEIEMVVNYMSGKFQSSLSTPFKLMDKFTKIHKAGLPYDHYERYFQALRSFSPAKLQDAIAKHYAWEQMHQVVVGKM